MWFHPAIEMTDAVAIAVISLLSGLVTGLLKHLATIQKDLKESQELHKDDLDKTTSRYSSQILALQERQEKREDRIQAKADKKQDEFLEFLRQLNDRLEKSDDPKAKD